MVVLPLRGGAVKLGSSLLERLDSDLIVFYYTCLELV